MRTVCLKMAGLDSEKPGRERMVKAYAETILRIFRSHQRQRPRGRHEAYLRVCSTAHDLGCALRVQRPNSQLTTDQCGTEAQQRVGEQRSGGRSGAWRIVRKQQSTRNSFRSIARWTCTYIRGSYDSHSGNHVSLWQCPWGCSC